MKPLRGIKSVLEFWLSIVEPLRGFREQWAFNEQVKNDNRIEPVLLALRDGLMLIRKK